MVRNALKEGLRLEAGYGVNPYKLGFIASPDDHQALPGAADEDYFTDKPVKFGVGGALGEMLRGNWWDDRPGGGNISNPGGLAGVWAEANTRESIFAALERKETFGTSGPRIRVRFFAWVGLSRGPARPSGPGRDGLPHGRRDGGRPADCTVRGNARAPVRRSGPPRGRAAPTCRRSR